MLSVVHRLSIRLFAAILLTLCVGVHALEVSGQWDRTFRDANDEAGIVAVVLCIGFALSAAGSVLRVIRLTRTKLIFSVAVVFASTRLPEGPVAQHALSTSPPLPLRI